jgi:hypothetical protein
VSDTTKAALVGLGVIGVSLVAAHFCSKPRAFGAVSSDSRAEHIRNLVEQAKNAVEADMAQKPVTSADGIWRFDAILRKIFGSQDREFYIQAEKIARAANKGFGTWTGYDVTASFCQTTAAYMTPGFAEARRKYMS